MSNTIEAIILCGGKSSRMGSDKGLLPIEKNVWAQLAYNKITSLGFACKVSISQEQIAAYTPYFSSDKFIVDQLNPSGGPIAGLLSVHLQAVENDLLVLACDMKDISVATIQVLLTVYESKKNDYDFFVYKNEENWEPLLGIYSSKGLKRIYTLFKDGKLKNNSMKNVLDISNTFFIPLTSEQQVEFKNYNEAKDLGGI